MSFFRMIWGGIEPIDVTRMCETHVTLTDDLADLENYSCLVPFENKVTQVIY